MAVRKRFKVGGLFRRKRAGKAKGRTRASAKASGSVGRYVLHEQIGQGAMGEVWRGLDPRIARPVAVKILNVPGGMSAEMKDAWEQRFIREARAAGMLSHPGIVAIHDVGMTDDGRPFIVMELVEGLSLEAIIQDGAAPSERDALEWVAQVAEALDAAHRREIVHRDVKPANILIDRYGRARIADFGIARLAESDLTHDGHFVGSPAFASPEQISGAAVDARSDLFSLGSTLYTVLTGSRPFRGDDLSSLAYAICHSDPAPPRSLAPKLSRACEAVLMKALARDPRRRYRTAQDLAEDLRAVATGQPPSHVAVPSTAVQASRGTDERTTLVADDGRGRGTAAGSTGSRRSEPSRAGTPRRSSPHGVSATILALGLALAAACIVGLLLARPILGLLQGGPTRVAETSRPKPASPSAVARPSAARPQAAAAGPTEPGRWAAGAAEAAVEVTVIHGLPDGVVSVWSGKRRLMRARMEGAGGGTSDGARWTVSDGLATASWPIRLPVGDHELRVEVASDTKGLELREQTPVFVREAAHYRLRIRVKERPIPKLELGWTEN